MSLAKPVKYTDQVDSGWSTSAVDTFRVTARPDSDDPVLLELDGRCPRCQDPMQHTESLIAFKGVSTTSDGSLRATVKSLRDSGLLNEALLPAEFSVQCCCKVKHPDPLGRSGLTGCGASWRMRIETVGEEE